MIKRSPNDFDGIRHQGGTSNYYRPGQSWIEYWEEKSCKSRGTCCILGCSNSANTGSHVNLIKSGYKLSSEWYIVPTCNGCNPSHPTPSDTYIQVKSNTVAVRHS